MTKTGSRQSFSFSTNFFLSYALIVHESKSLRQAIKKEIELLDYEARSMLKNIKAGKVAPYSFLEKYFEFPPMNEKVIFFLGYSTAELFGNTKGERCEEIVEWLQSVWNTNYLSRLKAHLLQDIEPTMCRLGMASSAN